MESIKRPRKNDKPTKLVDNTELVDRDKVPNENAAEELDGERASEAEDASQGIGTLFDMCENYLACHSAN